MEEAKKELVRKHEDDRACCWDVTTTTLTPNPKPEDDRACCWDVGGWDRELSVKHSVE